MRANVRELVDKVDDDTDESSCMNENPSAESD